ncbi:hypothetical protein [uncultured Nonlabens sp.]|uniref:hypothetical protein n=1 Tax=uncultured Nonlabens sp. TaxID=859306 RepID=UPI00262B899C|nr:hypothetical protein [uncultured Nonlabens sp.]
MLHINSTPNLPPLFIQPQSAPVGSHTGQIVVIDDQLFVYDQARGKWLSAQTTLLSYANENNSSGRFLEFVGDVTRNGAILPYDATIVYITVKALPTPTPRDKNIEIYIDNTPVPNNDTVSPEGISVDGVVRTSTNSNFFISRTHNIDVDQGQSVRVRVANAGGNIEDTVVLLWLKWRK